MGKPVLYGMVNKNAQYGDQFITQGDGGHHFKNLFSVLFWSISKATYLYIPSLCHLHIKCCFGLILLC